MEPNGLSPNEGPAPSQTDQTAVIDPPAVGADTDISQMTRDEIAAKIEDDSDFAAKVASGQFKIPPLPEAPAPDAVPAPAEIPPPDVDPAAIPPASPEQIAAAGEIPTMAPDPAAQPGEEPPAEAEILNFQIPAADMDGYSTPGEAIKANRHANAHIETQNEIIVGKDQTILDLNAKLAASQAQAPKPPPATAVPQ